MSYKTAHLYYKYCFNIERIHVDSIVDIFVPYFKNELFSV